ncbi:MAG: molybdopterin-dependent oxidoreductase [Desulfobacteraceae bacterium]|nr:molybdopterin-dependent oxidoreductase [Desulfobacteraceae bacterium]
MGSWHKTGCVLCAQNCGLEVFVENNKMVKVRPDKDNPRSQGYACRKGLSVIYHQYPKDRLQTPLKKVNGKFEPISWDSALEEIADKLKISLDDHGPRSVAYLGSSSQGGHFEAAYGVSLLKKMGSQNLYTSAGQEFSGAWWVQGRMFGKQYLLQIPDDHNTEMLIAWGWNGMVTHQMPQAPKMLKKIAKDPQRILVSVDPRKSETAKAANIHLPLRPGTDSLLIKSLISIILENGWENKEYIKEHTQGFDQIKHWFENFDYRSAIEMCGLEYDQVFELSRLMKEKKWSYHPDLGIYMGRNSTLNSYLLNVLGAICGIFGQKGGNLIPGFLAPVGYHADERKEKTWKTVITGMPPAAAGSFPATVLPEEILNDHPERIRNIILASCNPIRSWPDTKALEKAFSSLDLLVVCDIVMSETARLADYVLPCRTFYESWEATFFPWNSPEIYFQMRRPIIKHENDSYEAAQIMTMLADKMGFIPNIPDEVMEAASKDRMTFGAKLMEWLGANPKYLSSIMFILAKTIGKEWESASLAALWGLLMTAPKEFRKNAQRIGFEPGFDIGDRVFQAILDNPQGMWIGKLDENDNLGMIKTESGKIELVVPELMEQAENINAESEKEALNHKNEFPYILNAGRHTPKNINTMMRNPEWNKGKRACTVAVSPELAQELDIKDGDLVTVSTEAGSETAELEVSDEVIKNMVLIPHGFGLLYGDDAVYGINVNNLTSIKNRDFIGTPYHRYVPCRLEKA